jgi:hypothetical protein
MAGFDRGVAADVVRAAVFAADSEALRVPVPLSSVRNPDGSLQNETPAERSTRIVRTAVMHLLEQGLIVFPENIRDLLDDWIPVERVGRD